MSTPPPTAAVKSTGTAPIPPSSPATKWVRDNLILQTLTGSTSGALIAGWVAIGASLGGAWLAAAAMCIAFPVVGWFVGLPMAFAVGAGVGAVWMSVLGGLLVSWAVSAVALSA